MSLTYVTQDWNALCEKYQCLEQFPDLMWSNNFNRLLYFYLNKIVADYDDIMFINRVCATKHQELGRVLQAICQSIDQNGHHKANLKSHQDSEFCVPIDISYLSVDFLIQGNVDYISKYDPSQDQLMMCDQFSKRDQPFSEWINTNLLLGTTYITINSNNFDYSLTKDRKDLYFDFFGNEKFDYNTIFKLFCQSNNFLVESWPGRAVVERLLIK